MLDLYVDTWDSDMYALMYEMKWLINKNKFKCNALW